MRDIRVTRNQQEKEQKNSLDEQLRTTHINYKEILLTDMIETITSSQNTIIKLYI